MHEFREYIQIENGLVITIQKNHNSIVIRMTRDRNIDFNKYNRSITFSLFIKVVFRFNLFTIRSHTNSGIYTRHHKRMKPGQIMYRNKVAILSY